MISELRPLLWNAGASVFQVSTGHICSVPCTSPIAAGLMYSQNKDVFSSSFRRRDLTSWLIVRFQTSHLGLCSLFSLLENAGIKLLLLSLQSFFLPAVEGAFQEPGGETGTGCGKRTAGSPAAQMTRAVSRRLPWLIPAGRHRWHLGKRFTATWPWSNTGE